MPSKKFLEEFFELLKGEIAIWQTQSPKYRDRKAKKKAWERLLQKWKEVDKHATIDTVKRKYHGMRSCHRREFRNIRKSELSGGEIYVPTLWYFKNLEFLHDPEMQLEGKSTNDDSFEEDFEEEPIAKRKQFVQQSKPKKQSSVNHQSSFEQEIEEEPIAKRKPLFEQSKPIKQSAINTSHHLPISSHKTDKDEADIYGEAWAVTFRQLSPDQKIFAKRMMDEALMYAQLGQLSIASTINPGFQQVIIKTNYKNFIHSDESD